MLFKLKYIFNTQYKKSIYSVDHDVCITSFENIMRMKQFSALTKDVG